MTKTKWYAKPIYLLVALALVLSLGIVAVPMAGTAEAQVTEVWVDDDAPSGWYDGTHLHTMTEGIAAIDPGGTINVAAGTYAENVGIPAGKDNLQIIGHSNADTFITVGGGIGFDCYCPVTIKGFDISGTARGSGHAFCLRGGSGGTSANPGVFEDNKVHSLNYGMKTGDWDPRPEYWEIKNNDFYDLRLGVLLEHSYHFEISGNTFEDYKEGVTMGYCCDTARYINITDNEFLGTTDTELGAAILISSQAQDIHVLRNEIRDSIIGVLIKVKDLTCPELVNVNINLNNIEGNTTGVLNEAAVSVDATCNWWGAADGPSGQGSGDAVSTNVDFDPWLTGPFSMFQIDHAKMDFKKKPNDDKVDVRGRLGSSLTCGRDVEILEDVTVTVGPLSQTIDMEQKGKQGEKWEYKRPKDDGGIIKHMTINWKNGKFDFSMDKVDLSELTDPDEVTISIQIGDDLGEATIQMTETKHWDYKAP